jgi:hypothetical protein
VVRLHLLTILSGVDALDNHRLGLAKVGLLVAHLVRNALMPHRIQIVTSPHEYP